MSLPPLLLNRLKKRGLVKKQNESTSVSEAIEEIIAENYDDEDTNSPYVCRDDTNLENKRRKADEQFWLHRIKERIGVTESHHGYKLCPNKYNVWHKCSLYCVNRWTSTHTQPSQKYLRRFKRLLRKYPIEAGWKKVYDSGCKSFYFSNSTSQTVSWLPPSHPKARATQSAAIFRKQLSNSHDDFFLDSKTKTANLNESLDSENAFISSIHGNSKKPKMRDLDRKLQRRQRKDN
ncbi:uncharacterized protein PQBP1 [Drosophila pseudoobscura]|uniref:Uncharacterized protein PQBP1 n=1 Tax=Drosophila pseudoobscura pseudoobscura TaxID=46245 RepID=A0A6I8W7Z6_DROPS|nr:uncharacterized protein LOC117184773 [Drosophila pseudoobscura]